MCWTRTFGLPSGISIFSSQFISASHTIYVQHGFSTLFALYKTTLFGFSTLFCEPRPYSFLCWGQFLPGGCANPPQQDCEAELLGAFYWKVLSLKNLCPWLKSGSRSQGVKHAISLHSHHDLGYRRTNPFNRGFLLTALAVCLTDSACPCCAARCGLCVGVFFPVSFAHGPPTPFAETGSG